MSCARKLSTCYSRPRHKVKEVYVLKLKGGKYYVGESNNVRHRVWSHVNLNGSAWTRKHPVVSRISTITGKMNAFWELNETLEQMKLRGIDNVRGSMFSNIQLTKGQRKTVASLYCEKENLCRKCGSHAHFEDRCGQIQKASWMEDFLGNELPLPRTVESLKRGPPVLPKLGPPVLQCVVCDSILPPNSSMNYCGDFCRQRHSV